MNDGLRGHVETRKIRLIKPDNGVTSFNGSVAVDDANRVANVHKMAVARRFAHY
jgi:hypothetical protein